MPIIDILGEIDEISALEDNLKKHKLMGEAQELAPALLHLPEKLQNAVRPDEKIKIVKTQIMSLAEIIEQNIDMRYKCTDALYKLDQEREKINVEFEEKRPTTWATPESLNSKLANYDSEISEINTKIDLCQNSVTTCEEILLKSQKAKHLLENQLKIKKHHLAAKEKNLVELDQENLDALEALRAKKKKILSSMQEQEKSQFAAALETQQLEIQEELSKIVEEKNSLEQLLAENRQECELLEKIQNGEITLEEEQQRELDKVGVVQDMLNIYRERFNDLQSRIETLDDTIEKTRLQELEITKNLNDNGYIENNYLINQDTEEQFKIKSKSLENEIDLEITQIEANTKKYENNIATCQAEITMMQQKINDYDIEIKEHSLNLADLEQELIRLKAKKQEILDDKKLLKEQIKEEEELNSILDTSEENNLSLIKLNREMLKLRNNINNIEKMVSKQFDLLHQFEMLLAEIKQLSLSQRETATEKQTEDIASAIAKSTITLEEPELSELVKTQATIFSAENNRQPEIVSDIIAADEGFESDIGEQDRVRKQDPLLILENFSNSGEPEPNIEDTNIKDSKDLSNTALISEEEVDPNLIDRSTILQDIPTSIEDTTNHEEAAPHIELLAGSNELSGPQPEAILDEGFESDIGEQDRIRKQNPLSLLENFNNSGEPEPNIEDINIKDSEDLSNTAFVTQEKDEEFNKEPVAAQSPSNPVKDSNILHEEVIELNDDSTQIINSIEVEAVPPEQFAVVSKVEDHIIAVETPPPNVVVDTNIARNMRTATTDESSNIFSEVRERADRVLIPQTVTSSEPAALHTLSTSQIASPPPISKQTQTIQQPRKAETVYYAVAKISDTDKNQRENTNNLGVINGLLKIISPSQDHEVTDNFTKAAFSIHEEKTPLSKIDQAIFANNHLNENDTFTNPPFSGSQIIQNNMPSILIHNTFPLGGQIDPLLPMLPFIFMQTNKDKWINRMNRRKHKNIILASRYTLSTAG
ncbi:hypothetical protein [Candidatus Tisiphia endosymbiont of Nemotelus uliginosus]|uniref:hypothetical protein n=1 Tax=Candidatus Tisiphia endosymbiont of Nemotelus uliginosus TaxID=3077926 RepID=UPI0035C93314